MSKRLILCLFLTCLTPFAYAMEFRSAAESAILYDSPSEKGKRLFIIAEGTPVEIIVTLDKWVKVRDPSGAISWIEEARLSTKRTVLVRKKTFVRQRPASDAPPVFETVENLILEIDGSPADGWIKVRHEDGASGFIRAGEIWGL